MADLPSEQAVSLAWTGNAWNFPVGVCGFRVDIKYLIGVYKESYEFRTVRKSALKCDVSAPW